MDWNQLISIISENVKDDSNRTNIYLRLLEISDNDTEGEECLGYDDAFDIAWEQHIGYEDDEDDYAEEEDDYNYDEDE